MGRNEKFDRSAAVRCLELMGLVDSDNVELIKDGRYRHTARNGTVRELDVLSSKEYFARNGKYPGEKLHRVMTKFIVEVVVEKKGLAVAPVFYTLDANYKQYNGQRYKLIRQSADGKCREIELDCGDMIVAFTDETDGFIRQHENDPIKIPVNWELCGYVDIQEGTITDALEKYYEVEDHLELPEGHYIDGSFQLSTSEEDYIAIYNHPFRNPKRVRSMDGKEVSA